jgi:hypothetical protein
VVEAEVVGFFEDVFNEVARFAVRRAIIKVRRM